MVKNEMKAIILLLFMGFSVACFGQAAPDSTIQLDTITPTEISQKTLSELIGQLKEIGPKYDEAKAITTRYEDLVSRIMLIVTAYVDPDHFAGLTADNKILKK